MKKVLVTGSKGQLGNELREQSGLFPGFDFTFIDVEELDLIDDRQVFCFFAKQQFDYVINCAAYTAVDKAESEPGLAKLVNSNAPEILVRAATEYNPDVKIVHISTDYVFDGKNYRPYKEDDPVNPVSVYGKTKLEGENAIKGFDNVMIIRTSWLYSSFGHNFVKTVLRLAAEKDKLTIVSDQVGTPTYAGDLAAAILQIIAESSFTNGIYHYSNEGVASWYDFAKAILEEKRMEKPVIPIKTEDFPTPAKRPFYSVLDKTKIKKTFGLEIPHWRDSLRRCLEKL